MTRTILQHRSWLALAYCALAATAAAPASAGPAVRDSCVDCHGKDGASLERGVPIIGGLSAQYIEDSMAAYRDKERACPETKFVSGDKSRAPTDMCRVAAALDQATTKDLAKTLAAKPFVHAKQPTDAVKAAIGKKVHAAHCEKCHAKGGSSAADDSGILAGQWMPYLELSFKQFSDGSRPIPKKMKPKLEELTAEEKDALLHYYGSVQ